MVTAVDGGSQIGTPRSVSSVREGALGEALGEAFGIVTADEHQFELPGRSRGERVASPPTAEIDVATGGPAVVLVEDPDTGRVRWVLPTGLGRPKTRSGAAPDTTHFS